MQELTEREKKLIEFIKILVSTATIAGIFNDHMIKLFNWRQDSNQQAGLTMEFQDNMLKSLEEEFGINYTKLDPETHKPIEKSDGNKN